MRHTRVFDARFLISLAILCVIAVCASSCATEVKRTTPVKISPRQHEVTADLTPEQSQIFAYEVQSLIAQNIIPPNMAVSPHKSALEKFYAAHEIAGWLYRHRYFEDAIRFMDTLAKSVFSSPLSESFRLLATLAQFRKNMDVEIFVAVIQSRPWNLTASPFDHSVWFIQDGVPALVRAGYAKVAFQMIDLMFTTFGDATAFFDELENIAAAIQIDLWLSHESPHNYQSTGFRGLVWAKRLVAEYHALRFDEFNRGADYFMKHFPRHHFSPMVRDLMRQARQKSTAQGWPVALLLPLSGPSQPIGRSILDGITYAFRMYMSDVEGAEVDAASHSVILFPIDTHRYTGQALESRLSRLIENENIYAIIGPLTSHNYDTIRPIIQKYLVPTLNLSPTTIAVDEKPPPFSVFPVVHMRPSLEAQLAYMLELIKESILPYKRVALLYPDNGYGRFHAQAFYEASLSLGKTLAAAEMYDPDDPRSFKDTVQKLLGLFDSFDRKKEFDELKEAYKEAHPDKEIRDRDIVLPPKVNFDILFMPASVRDASMFIPFFKYYDADTFVVMGTDLWQNQELLTRAAPFLQKVIFFNTFFVDDPDAHYLEFYDRFNKQYLSRFNKDHYLGYLVASLFSQAVTSMPPQYEAQPGFFLQHLSRLRGQSLLGQNWSFWNFGRFRLDPIPIVVLNRRFSRLIPEIMEDFRQEFTVSGYNMED